MSIENRIVWFSMLVLHLFIICLSATLLVIISLLVDENNDKKKNTLLVLSKLINGVEISKIL
jgi:hypothetical protein